MVRPAVRRFLGFGAWFVAGVALTLLSLFALRSRSSAPRHAADTGDADRAAVSPTESGGSGPEPGRQNQRPSESTTDAGDLAPPAPGDRAARIVGALVKANASTMQADRETDSDRLPFDDPKLSDAIIARMEATDAEMQTRISDCVRTYVRGLSSRPMEQLVRAEGAIHVTYDTYILVRNDHAQVARFESIEPRYDTLIDCLREAEVWSQSTFPAAGARDGVTKLRRTASFFVKVGARDAGG